jgi:hypothetical protein
VEIYWEEKPKNRDKNQSKCHLVHHKTHKDWPGSEPEPQRWETNRMSHGMVYIHTHTCMHAYIRTCIHTYIHTYVRTYVRTYIDLHTYIHTYIYAYTNCFNNQ